MAKASLQSVYNISPDEIWQPIGKFNALPIGIPRFKAAGWKTTARGAAYRYWVVAK